MANLMNSLYMTDSVKNHQEIIDLATKLMKSDHLDYRNNAIQLLSFTYNIIGQSEKAKEYAKMLSYNEDLLIHVLRGQELIEHCQWYFWRQCDSMQQALNYLLDEPAGGYSAKERHSLRKWLYDLYHDVFHDGDFGFWEDRLARLCYAMAVDSINTGNKERSLTELAEMAEHCSKADSFNYIKHTSLLVNTLHYDAKQVAKSDPESLCSYFLKKLGNDCFQAIYKEPLFLSVQATLEQNNKNTPT